MIIDPHKTETVREGEKRNIMVGNLNEKDSLGRSTRNL
jgi:hypothetical protein